MKEFETLLKGVGYSHFTQLQKEAFSHPKILADDWMFVIGDTSSGKTLIPLFIYIRALQSRQKRPRMLFAVPYRALAAQKAEEIEALFGSLGITIGIAQSTGEFRDDDKRILQPDAGIDIAVIIYEKAFLFENLTDSFIGQFDYLVLDEIGLTQDEQRGIKADLLLSAADKCRDKTRVIALGTPFYDWHKYIDSYRFEYIYVETRPLQLDTNPIFASKDIIYHVPKGCMPILPGPYHAEREVEWRFSIVAKICDYHLRLGHRILVFMNNREQVRLLAAYLVDYLRNTGVLEQWSTPKKCRESICSGLGISEYDINTELYSILDEKDFEAISYGIAFHNADLMYPIRNYIEREILNADGHLRIVCCTETLAYGINSNVDVVIIPQLLKTNVLDGKAHYLTPNEYMNYSGRAGRLRGESSTEDDRVGYVYPIINAPYDLSDGVVYSEKTVRNREQWDELCEVLKSPQLTFCKYFILTESAKPFYLLGLFPKAKGTEVSTPLSELRNRMLRLPRPDNYTFSEEEDILQPLDSLVNVRLIAEDYERESLNDSDRTMAFYRLTDIGRALAGYIIDMKDYLTTMDMMSRNLREDGRICIGDLIYSIISYRSFRTMLHSSLHGVYKPKKTDNESTAHGKVILSHVYHILTKPYVMERMSDSLKKELYLTEGEDAFQEEMQQRIVTVNKTGRITFYNKTFELRLRAFAAVFMWIDLTCTTKNLYDRLRINTQKYHQIAEQLSYYFDLFSAAAANLDIGGPVFQRKEKTAAVSLELKRFSQMLYYQLPYQICDTFEIDPLQIVSPGQAYHIAELKRICQRLVFIRKKRSSRKKAGRSPTENLKKEAEICRDLVSRLDSAQAAVIKRKFKEELEWK